ncbi:MAG: NAD(P)H-hydrate epimerase, partial [Clostridia bacterium]|nr:NAD(P)H-hydrate epimerase [Clostridia bacterium]
MKLARTGMISNIDAFLEERMGIQTVELMKKAGDAVGAVVRERVGRGKKVVILAGGGNNGGDGYATAMSLFGDYEITVFDVLSRGQKNECGKFFLEKCREAGIKIEALVLNDTQKAQIKGADCIIDAVFGTGMHGDPPEMLRALAIVVRECVGAFKIAIDVPIGVDADHGTAHDFAVTVGVTVELSYIKPGIISYPAKSYAGEIVYADLDIPKERIEESFDFKYHYVDKALARELLPRREANSNKGSFGKAMLITGSSRFKGAGQLTLSAALRTGAGYVSYVGDGEECDRLLSLYPEAIYKRVGAIKDLTDLELSEIVKESESYTAVLIGSGSESSPGLLRLIEKFLERQGAPII